MLPQFPNSEASETDTFGIWLSSTGRFSQFGTVHLLRNVVKQSNETESPKRYFQLFILLSEMPLFSPDSGRFPGNGIIAPCSGKNAHKRP